MKKSNLLNTNLISKNDHILIAVSGGPDSVALLHQLHDISSVYRLKLLCAHYNHKLRGKQSDADSEFVKNMCKELGVAFYCDSNKSGKKLNEKKARDMRYSFLVRTAIKAGVNKIALAHNLDDDAETVLFRLIKGSGAHGLKGIPEKRRFNRGDFGINVGSIEKIKLIRPLLHVEKKDILNYLNSSCISFRTDRTNRTDMYDRNKIRNKLIPYIEENLHKGFKKSLHTSASIIGAENSFLEKLAEKEFNRAYVSASAGKAVINRKKITVLDDVVLKRVMIMIMKKVLSHHRNITSALVDVLCASVRKSLPVILPEGLKVSYKDEKMLISAAKDKIVNRPEKIKKSDIGKRIAFGDAIFEISTVKRVSKKNIKSADTAYLDMSKISFPLILRHRMPGDRFVPFGRKSAVKLKDCIISSKSGKEIPVIEDKNGILWLCGCRIDNRAAVSKSTEQILKILKKQQN